MYTKNTQTASHSHTHTHTHTDSDTHTYTQSISLQAGKTMLLELESYLIHIGGVLFNDVLLLQHLVGLTNLGLMWQALVPAVQQLNASLLHSLSCLTTQVLQTK